MCRLGYEETNFIAAPPGRQISIVYPDLNDTCLGEDQGFF